MKVAIYAICRDEEKFAGRFIASCEGADVVCVADTGSRDNSVEILRLGGAIVHGISIQPWRFDDARNAALALVPGDVDICIALDLDETLSPGWRDALENGWLKGTTRASHDIVMTRDANGAPRTQFRGERIHARHGYRWRHICHEALYPSGIVELRAHLPGIVINHRPDPAKNRSYYLELLRRAGREEPGSARMARFLGREELRMRNPAEALTALHRHLALAPVARVEERALSMRYIARCHILQNELGDALRWLNLAVSEAPSDPDGWRELALEHYRRADWTRCIEAVNRALALKTTATPLFPSEIDITDTALEEIATICAWHLGDTQATWSAPKSAPPDPAAGG